MNPFSKNTKQLGLFVTAGYPKLNSTKEQVLKLDQKGVDFIEIGIPFSDPIADGPTIQETSAVALANGMNLKVLFEQIATFSNEVKCPLVLMGYLNPVLTYGLELFLKQCQQNKIHSVILPDMSSELYERFYKSNFLKFGVTPCFLITQTTENKIIQSIVDNCQNSFVYLVSTNSITGSNAEFQLKGEERIAEIKQLLGDIPLFVGFGISKKADIQAVHAFADGAIIGSAYLNALRKGEEDRFLNSIV
jgi:tryptophan synthase alpha chain